MIDKTYNVLFLCTGNTARSLMAEALLTTMGHGKFHAYSAGNAPTGYVHHLAIEQIKTTDYPLEQLRSKSWDEFTMPDAPHMDFIITVCADTADEACPYWPGHPLTAHWTFEDPSKASGTEEEQRKIFHKVFREIMGNIHYFANLPIHLLDKNAVHDEIKTLGAPKA